MINEGRRVLTTIQPLKYPTANEKTNATRMASQGSLPESIPGGVS